VAPLGTSLTQTQARLLATLHPSPIVATDADPAGRTAAERAYWLLTQHSVSPRTTALPEGTDPADILRSRGPEALALAMNGGHALAQQLIDNVLARPLSNRTLEDVAAITAADDPALWLARAHDFSHRTNTRPAELLTAWPMPPPLGTATPRSPHNKGSSSCCTTPLRRYGASAAIAARRFAVRA
jgi:DNA primase